LWHQQSESGREREQRESCKPPAAASLPAPCSLPCIRVPVAPTVHVGHPIAVAEQRQALPRPGPPCV